MKIQTATGKLLTFGITLTIGLLIASAVTYFCAEGSRDYFAALSLSSRLLDYVRPTAVAASAAALAAEYMLRSKQTEK